MMCNDFVNGEKLGFHFGLSPIILLNYAKVLL
jgi:hypothetical protein